MKLLKWLAVAAAGLLLLAGTAYGYVGYLAEQRLAQTFSTHDVELPTPWPLNEDELAELEGAAEDIDVQAIALERARERGKHLANARYVCVECHGADFGGGVMIDEPALGRLYGPNLTGGKGSAVTDYTIADWDRIVRHGITKRGTATVMPSVDFLTMSDQELSDIIVYIQSFPPIDKEVPTVEFGPIGKFLLATGKLELSADHVDHQAAHPRLPPETGETVEFGRHLAQVCAGCHGSTFRGGPIAAGPPDWPPAFNLTPHAEGLSGWTFEQFDAVMRNGKRRDGAPLKAPMDEMVRYAVNMTDTEMRAMFKFFLSLPPEPTLK